MRVVKMNELGVAFMARTLSSLKMAFTQSCLVLTCIINWSLLCTVYGVIQSVVIDEQTGKLSIRDGFRPDFVAWANFTDDIEASGWSYLEVTTSGRYEDRTQAYAAGAVEAVLTSDLLYKHWVNTVIGYCGPFDYDAVYCQRLKTYIMANLQWVTEQIERESDSPYWHQVYLTLLQLRGLEDSYNGQLSIPTGVPTFNPFGFLLFQMGGDLEDLEAALNKTSQSRTLGSGSCSALVKLLPGNKELFVSHDTWNNYQSMLRIMKNPATRGQNIVANRLAQSGKEWADLFSKFNSGTYNNQWMVVDFKHFSPGRSDVTEQLFTVLEQIPGLVVTEDKTKELYEKGYWASYNIPYYEDIFNASGCPALVDRFGSWFTFDLNPRAQIFRRNQSLVTDLESMVQLMRYNNFEKDPLSQCEGCNPCHNGENSISARSDLNPANGTYPFGALKQRPHGGTDMKVTSYAMYKEYQLLAASGPTWKQVPVFQWSTSPFDDLLHMGHPDRWAFPTVLVKWP
uniref:Phospholipase B-like n=1 Tax=Denticeps clupeoides TaxID=299321 RepID=A0AAY4A1C3_9TELE